MQAGLFVVGVLVTLVGLYLCITGAPAVAIAGDGGFWGIVGNLPPRFVAGVVLIVLGGWLMGANVSAILGSGGGGSASALIV